jgi:drug/metabolite transporter (DMT)-like permease
MTPLALGLLLLSAALHASWNLLLKQAADRQAAAWWAMLFGAAAFLPALAFFQPLPIAIWPYLLASAAAEAAYYFLLATAYDATDFSIAYPIARGTAPGLLALWAMLFLNESPSAIGWAGMAILAVGLMTTGGVFGRRSGRATTVKATQASSIRGVMIALAVAVCISAYSIIDGAAVRLVPALPYTSLVFLLTALFLTPLVAWRSGRVAMWREGRRHPGRLALIGILSLLAYLLVLVAYGFAPIAYVGAVRELNILFGVVLGAWVLKEPVSRGRWVGVVLIVVGVIVIALAD